MKLTDISTAQDMGIELEIAEGLQAGFPSPAQDHAGETIDLAREMVRHPESTFHAHAHFQYDRYDLLPKPILFDDF